MEGANTEPDLDIPRGSFMEQVNETGLDRFVPNVWFKKIPIQDLYANQQYQRNISETAILKKVED